MNRQLLQNERDKLTAALNIGTKRSSSRNLMRKIRTKGIDVVSENMNVDACLLGRWFDIGKLIGGQENSKHTGATVEELCARRDALAEKLGITCKESRQLFHERIKSAPALFENHMVREYMILKKRIKRRQQTAARSAA